MPKHDPSNANDQDACPPGVEVVNGRSQPTSLFPQLDFSPDPNLEAGGWERRFMADPVRAKEAAQLYRKLGFEVRAEAVKPTELYDVCGDCRLMTCRAYVTIYTRKRPF